MANGKVMREHQLRDGSVIIKQHLRTVVGLMNGKGKGKWKTVFWERIRGRVRGRGWVGGGQK